MHVAIDQWGEITHINPYCNAVEGFEPIKRLRRLNRRCYVTNGTIDIMPWTDKPGGNDNGPKGNGGPWGNGGRSGGQNGSGPSQPPDLEELLKSGRDRFKRVIPGGKGGNGGFKGSAGGGSGGGVGMPELNQKSLIIGGIFLALVLLFMSYYQINPQERGVVTTFGQYSSIESPGYHFKIPFAQNVIKVPVDIQQTAYIGFTGGGGRTGTESPAENLMLTSDRNIVDVSFTVDWKISNAVTSLDEYPNAAKFIFNIDAPHLMVKHVAEASMRETIGSSKLEDIITSGQATVVERTRVRIQSVLDSYKSGIEVLRVNMEKPEPPTEVRGAFVDVVKAGSEKKQAINDAERVANQIIPVAEGNARKIFEEARAYAATMEAETIGEAERFTRVYNEYRRAPEVTRERLVIENREKILNKMNKIILEDDSGSNVVPYLPLNELNKSAASAPASAPASTRSAQ